MSIFFCSEKENSLALLKGLIEIMFPFSHNFSFPPETPGKTVQFPTKNHTSLSKLFWVGKKGYLNFSGLVSVSSLLPVLTACAVQSLSPRFFP